jgi:ring-1,2-phenylacetyl-CoA epoxidase subunit PaaC
MQNNPDFALDQLTPTKLLLLQLSDDRLVLGQRLGEWCGHGPMIEEDIALSNIALDLFGHATNGLEIVARELGSGVTADRLAFFREPKDFKNLQLVEQPNGDFAATIVRQFLFDAYSVSILEQIADKGLHGDEELAGWAEKCLKEDRYHLRHSGEWVLRLGDGTAESHRRTQEAIDTLWRFTGELQTPVAATKDVASLNYLALTEKWIATVRNVFNAGKLTIPATPTMFSVGGRAGKHSEHLSHLLGVMQVLPRSDPTAIW